MDDSLIRIVDLVKHYAMGDAATLTALQGLSFSIASGEFVAIMGPSGSGKSTLMNILGCLDVPSSGHYYLDGVDTAALNNDQLAALRNRQLGFVFQGFNLLPRKTVLDNIALPLLYAGLTLQDARYRATAMLERVGLSRYVKQRPNQLSGGQQQRVAIARALINEPKMILADEPTGNLDTHTSEEIMTLFGTLNREQGITLVLVTHEMDIAWHARRLLHIVDGRIAHDGKLQSTMEPTTS